MSLRSLKSSLTKPFALLWVKVWGLIPDRCKRLCLLTSLYVYLVGCTEDDATELAAMNQRLHLTRDLNALRFPALLSSVIWRGLGNVDTLDVQQPNDRLVVRLVRRTPCWLRYADSSTMREDILKVFKTCKVLGHSQPAVH